MPAFRHNQSALILHSFPSGINICLMLEWENLEIFIANSCSPAHQMTALCRQMRWKNMKLILWGKKQELILLWFS